MLMAFWREICPGEVFPLAVQWIVRFGSYFLRYRVLNVYSASAFAQPSELLALVQVIGMG
jgi:hypothetical protein